MSNLPVGAWKNENYKEDPPPPISRHRALVEIDFLYGTGKISRAYWSQAFDNLSAMICRDYRFAISPAQCVPLTRPGEGANRIR